ncbi:DUF302 domain-containing protein [Salegentibacter sediminis]|uniref:DUF302 domain-containing protein n=1 Tax=Salegentibacter sediminis TaxID=1930251 RepID=UPI0009C0DAF0|nr:DUF302 domain-containing protein [Salegentibacter sediminis]
MRILLFFVVFNVLFLGQGKAQEEQWAAVMQAESRYDFKETYTRLTKRLAENSELKIFAEIDHSQNGREVGLELAPARLIIFGNAKAGTPLMQNRQVAGLDLPLKILLGEDEKGKVFLAYSDVDHLRTRHALKSRKILNNIKKSLKDIAKDVTGRNPNKTGRYKIRYKEGIESYNSSHSFNETLTRLINEITVMDGMRLFAKIDHTKNAEKLGMGLRPATLLVFGNPVVGTELMQEARLSALELPVKMLVWRDEAGAVKISYNSSEFLSTRFRINKNLEALRKIEKVQAELVQKAAGHPSE